MYEMRRAIAMEKSTYSFEKEYFNNELKDFEMSILSDQICSSFIPTSFIRETDRLTAIYSYDGFLKISQCRFREIIQLLNLVERVIRELVKSGSYYLDYGRVELTCDTVFYCSETQEVKLAYIPIKEDGSFGSNLTEFVTGLKNCYFGNSVEYLDRLTAFLQENNYGTDDILNKIIELKREVNMYGVK